MTVKYCDKCLDTTKVGYVTIERHLAGHSDSKYTDLCVKCYEDCLKIYFTRRETK